MNVEFHFKVSNAFLVSLWILVRPGLLQLDFLERDGVQFLGVVGSQEVDLLYQLANVVHLFLVQSKQDKESRRDEGNRAIVGQTHAQAHQLLGLFSDVVRHLNLLLLFP